MAFVHCEKCSWEQDDFWSWSYNPARSFLRSVRENMKPRMIQFDTVSCFGLCHSWRVIIYHAATVLKRIASMHWPTAKAWKKATADKWPTCPRCGKNSLDVD